MDDRGLRFAEAWFRLLAEAARGTLAAQATIRSLADAELTPEKLAGRIAKWLPAGVPPPRGEALQQWTEDLAERRDQLVEMRGEVLAAELWKTVGVVPRSRHIELLERYEALRSRLEEAEVSIRRLKRLLSEKGHEGDAQKLLDLWSSAVGETLKSQADWMRTWIGSAGGADEVEAVPTPPPAKPAKPRRK